MRRLPLLAAAAAAAFASFPVAAPAEAKPKQARCVLTAAVDRPDRGPCSFPAARGGPLPLLPRRGPGGSKAEAGALRPHRRRRQAVSRPVQLPCGERRLLHVAPAGRRTFFGDVTSVSVWIVKPGAADVRGL